MVLNRNLGSVVQIEDTLLVNTHFLLGCWLVSLADAQTIHARKGEKIRTLKDVLQITSGRIDVIIELIMPGIKPQVVVLVREKYQGQ